MLSQENTKHKSIQELVYQKGAFIVPFAGDHYLDALTTAIITDYNKTNELDDDELQVPVYCLLHPLICTGYQLVEPQIAQHLGTPTRYGWPCYLQVAEAGGFLSMEFLLDNETSEYLNNHDFNVFMWPYNPDPRRNYETMASLTNKRGCEAVRNFVRNGGGYIGSCYGALAASAGIVLPIPVFSLQQAYHPELPCIRPFVSFALSDSLMYQKLLPTQGLFVSTAVIDDRDHPLAFGMNSSVTEFFDGPWFLWIGPNTHSVATFTHLESEKINRGNNLLLKQSVIGKPSWVHSAFGDGKVVLFSSHPELVNNISILFERFDWNTDRYYGRRVVHNALFYVTAQKIDECHITTMYPLWFIEELIAATDNLTFETDNSSVFHAVKRRVLSLNRDLVALRNTSRDCWDLFIDQFNGSLLEGESRVVAYIYYYCDIFRDLNNKTLDTLGRIEELHPVFLPFNNSFFHSFRCLICSLSDRLKGVTRTWRQVSTESSSSGI